MNHPSTLRGGRAARQVVLLAMLALLGAPALAQAELASPAAGQRLSVAGDTLWDLSAKLAARYPGQSRAQVMVALLRANPQAFVQGNLHRLRVGVPLTLPSPAQVQAEPAAAALALVESHRQLSFTAEGAPPVSVTAVPAAEASAVPVPVAASVAMAPAAPDRPEVVVQPPQTPTGFPLHWLGLALAVVAAAALWWWWRRVPALPEELKVPWSVSRARFEEGVSRATRVSQAAADLARQVEQAPAAQRLVAVAPAQAEPGDALALHEQAGTISEDDARLQLLIARTWLELGRVAAAQRLLAAMAAVQPAPPWAEEVRVLSASAAAAA